MLNLLRHIDFPDNVKIHSVVIRAKTLRFAKNHHEIIEFAQDDAKQLIAQAQKDAEAIRRNARQELALDMRKDIQAIGNMAQNRISTISRQASHMCIDICNTTLNEFIGELPDAFKINKLVSTLLERSLSSQHLVLECAEEQLDLVQTCLAQVITEQMAIRTWEVQVADDLQPFELRIRAAKGSEINVSMANIMALYEKEIKNLQREIAASIQTTGEHYEKVD